MSQKNTRYDSSNAEELIRAALLTDCYFRSGNSEKREPSALCQGAISLIALYFVGSITLFQIGIR